VIYGTLLTAKGDLRFLNQLSAVGILLNVVLNALLIPKYGASGSAIATLITQSMTALIQTLYCHNKLHLGNHMVELFRFVALALVLLVVTLVFRDENYSWIILLISGILSLFIFKLIDIRGILHSLKNVVPE